MPLHLRSLDTTTRDHMLKEIEKDLSEGTLYISARLTPEGAAAYAELLKTAAAQQDEEWLGEQIRRLGYLKSHEQKRTPSGGFTMAKVPITAHETLAEGEFNRFYCRGVCLRAVVEASKVKVYRAKEVRAPRAESEAKVGAVIDPEVLLADLRLHQGVEPALGVPPGPNSGLSIHLV